MAAARAMKRRTSDTDRITGTIIINSQMADITEASQRTLPKVSTLIKQIRRVRQKVGKAPAQSKSLMELVLPERCTMYEPSSGVKETFLLSIPDVVANVYWFLVDLAPLKYWNYATCGMVMVRSKLLLHYFINSS